MPKVAPGLRRYIAAALAGSDAGGADDTGLRVLLDSDPGVIEAAVRSLMAQLPTLPPPKVEALTHHLLHLAQDRKTPLSPHSQVAVVRLLGAVEDPGAAEVLWDRILPPHSAEVRTAALQALGNWVTAPGRTSSNACSPARPIGDFRVAAPALFILNRLPVPDRRPPRMAGPAAARTSRCARLALEKVGDRDTKEVAAALMRQLGHPDRNLREAALARLTRLEQGRKALTAALLEAEWADQAWQLARAQVPFARGSSHRVARRCSAAPRSSSKPATAGPTPSSSCSRETDAADLRDRLEAAALARRKKKAYPAALLYLRLPARPGAGFRHPPGAGGLRPQGLRPRPRRRGPRRRSLLAAVSTWPSRTRPSCSPSSKSSSGWNRKNSTTWGFTSPSRIAGRRKWPPRCCNWSSSCAPRFRTAQAAKSKLRSAALD